MNTQSKIKTGNKNGFTLAEILISIGLFATIAIVAGSIFTDLSNLEKKSSIRDSFFTSISIILQQLTNEIQNGTVDYEEYYNMEVIKSGYYGTNYGAYGSRLYNPGYKDGALGSNPKDLGTECSYPKNIEDGKECEIFIATSFDLETGQNPFDASDSETPTQSYANAFCDNFAGCSTIVKTNELYLIDKTGTQKTIIGKKKRKDSDYSIGILRMSGRDIDGNGFMDIFSCTEDFNCETPPDGTIKYPLDQETLDAASITLPKKSDLEAVFIANSSNFIPISPANITIKDLKFMINPPEDPFKAYNEKSAQMHPSITIFIKLGLAAQSSEAYPGEFPDVEVQTTVPTAVTSIIESYPPVDDIINLTTGDDESWIKKVLPGGVN